MDLNETSVDSGPAPPEPLLSDYIEMIYLSFVISVGIPTNAIILRKLFLELKRAPKDSVKSGFILLKINLNISDILLLMTAFVKLIWLYTYEWRFGDLFCPVYQYMAMFTLYVSSNIVVCIAIDRLRNVIYANKMQRSHKHISPVQVLLIVAWAAAFICSLPQFYFFRNFNIAPSLPDGWYQCTDIWQYYMYTGYGPYPEAIMSVTAQNTYNVSHLIIVFWGPVAMMMISYVIIAYKLMQYALQGVQAQPDTARKETIEEETPMVQDALVAVQKDDRFWTRVKSVPMVDTIRRNSRFMISAPTSSRRPSNAGQTPLSPKVPAWRRQLRSKVFRTTFLVVVFHVVCWFPYNSLALMKYINDDVYLSMNDNMNIFKDLQFLITLINPFLYGFSK